jgi:CheY-like chemotaxis protein
MERRQVLIVDDYPGALYLRSRILSDAGYEVIEASTGTDALDIAKARKPALILLDINLPDISGVEVCEQLKRDPATSSIPIIHITGAWISEEARQRGLASGASAYLIEPVDDVLLLKTVVGLIESQT